MSRYESDEAIDRLFKSERSGGNDPQNFSTSHPAKMYVKPAPLTEEQKAAARARAAARINPDHIPGVIPLMQRMRQKIAVSSEFSQRQKTFLDQVFDAMIEEFRTLL